MNRNVILTLLMAGALSGCATMYTVSIDSINSQQPTSGKSCTVVPADKISPDDLQFKEYAGYVKRALALKGYTVLEGQAADISVTLNYGTSGPIQNTYTYATPVFGQTGETATTVGNDYSSTTTVSPTYGLVGMQQNTGTSITYMMQIWLAAYETKDNKLLWKTEIKSVVNDDDLRRAFPIMIAASSKYLGESTAQKLDVTIYEDSKDVQAIKGINPVQNTTTDNSNQGSNNGVTNAKSNKGNM